MENYKLVMPEHLNQYGFLFGGNMLKWVDEYAYIAAKVGYPGSSFVTVAMDKVEFKKSVKQGTILIFNVEKVKTGNSSVQYSVNVFSTTAQTEKDMVFSTKVTFVRVNEDGTKLALPK